MGFRKDHTWQHPGRWLLVGDFGDERGWIAESKPGGTLPNFPRLSYQITREGMQDLLRDPAVRMRSQTHIEGTYTFTLGKLRGLFVAEDVLRALQAASGTPSGFDRSGWDKLGEEVRMRIMFDTCLAQGAMGIPLFAELLDLLNQRCEFSPDAHVNSQITSFNKLVSLWDIFPQKVVNYLQEST